MEGLERRRTRRLRRQLEEVAAGTTVTGYVDRVINDGVLVSITSLGSLNVTGLIHKRDLPVQFQVPSNLKDIFQIQLLQQDFMPGREVICGVSQVHPNPSSALTYNLKLQFEEFGAAPDDELHFEDKFDSMTEKEKDAIITNRKFALHEDDDDEEDNEEQNGVDDNDDSEESDFEEEFGDMETEVKEIYEELLAASIAADAEAPPQAQLPSKRKPKPVARRTELRVQDLYDWEALQEMLEEGDIVPDDVEDALRLVGLKTDDASATLSLQQFQAVIGILQNSIEGDGQEGDVEEDEGNEGQVADLSRGSAARIGAPNFNQASASKAQAAMSHLDDHDPGYEVEEDEVGEGEEGELSAGEEFEEMLQEVFDELKGRDGKVTVKAFKAWADIQEMLNQGVLDMATLDSMIQEATGAPVVAKASGKKGSKAVGKAAKEPSLDFEQFAQLVQDLDEVAGGPYEDDDEDGAFEDSDGDGGDDNQPVVPREIFDTLTKGQPKLKVKDFAAWEDVRELMQDEQLGTEDLKEFVGRVGSTMNGELDYEQFCELFDLVLNPNGHEDDSSDINEEATDNEEEEDDSDDSAAVRADDSSGNVQSEEDRALTLELFDELRGKAEKVSVKDFIAWDEVQQLLQDEYLDMESLEALLQTVGSSPQGQLDFEQFSDLLGIIEDTVETMENEDMEGEDRDGTNIDSSDSGLPSAQQVASTIDQRESNRRGSSRYASKSSAIESYNRQFNDNDDDEDYDEEGVTDRDTGREEGEPSDEELDDMARLVFDELRPSGRDTVPVKAFVAWNGIQNEIAAGVLNRAEVQQVVRSVDPAGAGELTFDQFLSAMNQLEVIIEERTNPEWENEQGSIGQAEEIALPKLSAPVPKTASNKASSAMKQDAAVGFGKVVAPVQQGKNDKKSADEEEQYEATQREIEALSAEIFAEIKGKVCAN